MAHRTRRHSVLKRGTGPILTRGRQEQTQKENVMTNLSGWDQVFRWLHVFAGILWIGLLYFFNFVNGPFAGTLDADSRKKVLPELMPRALFWLPCGAARTSVTGLLLLRIL